jgi:hypothetical protein
MSLYGRWAANSVRKRATAVWIRKPTLLTESVVIREISL